MVRKATTKRKTSARAGAGYKPSKVQREVVTSPAAHGVKRELIAQCIFHPRTGKTISRAALYRHFRDELVEGTKGVIALACITLVQEILKGGELGVMAAGAWLEAEEKRNLDEIQSGAIFKKH